MLLRAGLPGVNYHDQSPLAKTSVDVQVFEPDQQAGRRGVLPPAAIILQPDGVGPGCRRGIQSHQQNGSPPPCLLLVGWLFLFSLPRGATMNQVSAVSAAGMPVIQTPIDKGNNKEAIAYAFRPGGKRRADFLQDCPMPYQVT